MGFISPYAIFGTGAAWAGISALAFRLRPHRLLCLLTNSHGTLVYQPRQQSDHGRSLVLCPRCAHSRHYSDESQDNRSPDWYTVFAGGIAWIRTPSARFHSRLAWYEGAVMAYSNREAAAVFARERRLPQAARVFVTGFTTSFGTELFAVGPESTLV